MVSAQARAELTARLSDIETNKRVKILYACESGSRAWGFPSQDSDYDCRFIYIHERDWYLSIDERIDVIETSLVDVSGVGVVDIGGWEVRKALKHFRKSNPVVFEWLDSPIVYRQDTSFSEQLRLLAPQYFSQPTSFYHYFSMAQRNFVENFETESVKLKKYFYVLRPLLASRYIESKTAAAPMLFSTLLHQTNLDASLIAEIEALRERKVHATESDVEPKNPLVMQFINDELSRLAPFKPSKSEPKPDAEEVNRLFRETLNVG
jgi:uncharacterized protein